MNQTIVNIPANLARTPFYSEPMVRFSCVKAKVDIAWCTSISIVKLRAFVTRIVKDIDQETICSISRNFNINFLPR
ncbi:hypothetical protein GSbR_05030 [Geobacter sp. SVR]|nr:hypothetical protein GSVR_09670 [Geobacter sp. SVR]GCF83903.1 hypothetical protein GSbR_05030 [Geobacter sp. SVR]